MASQDSILILGIGNLLWADEGFGVRCVEALNAAWAFPANVTVLDGGTQGLYLLPFVTEAKHLLVFDAVDYGLPPGTMKRVEGDEVPQFLGAKKMSLHQTGFQEVLASARMLDRFPESLLLIGVQPVELEDFGGSLRPEVSVKVPEAIEIALEWLSARGVTPRARQPGETPADDSALSRVAYEQGRPDEREACRIGDVRFFPETS
ncbi:HyaD/HybD family hydrogenase maturation endopeptidase [Zoogloeaceae bacterium G21618-S1]|nr:HyaD/HybD family hydrogenase maturation endopeptidase [Zoogloeaceae bacterium G21618-S1]